MPLLGEVQMDFLVKPVVAYTLRHRLYARGERVTEETISDWWDPIPVPGTRRAALAFVRTSEKGRESPGEDRDADAGRVGQGGSSPSGFGWVPPCLGDPRSAARGAARRRAPAAGGDAGGIRPRGGGVPAWRGSWRFTDKRGSLKHDLPAVRRAGGALIGSPGLVLDRPADGSHAAGKGPSRLRSRSISAPVFRRAIGGRVLSSRLRPSGEPVPRRGVDWGGAVSARGRGLRTGLHRERRGVLQCHRAARPANPGNRRRGSSLRRGRRAAGRGRQRERRGRVNRARPAAGRSAPREKRRARRLLPRGDALLRNRPHGKLRARAIPGQRRPPRGRHAVSGDDWLFRRRFGQPAVSVPAAAVVLSGEGQFHRGRRNPAWSRPGPPGQAGNAFRRATCRSIRSTPRGGFRASTSPTTPVTGRKGSRP